MRINSDNLTKRGPGARKVKRGHYLVFQGKGIFKKSHCCKRSLFSVSVKTKQSIKKKIFILRGATVKCSKTV